MHNRKIQIIFLIAFSLLVSFVYFLAKPIAEGGDTKGYLKLSENLVNHQVYSLQDSSPLIPTIRRAPLYPIFIAFTTFGSNNKYLIIFSQILIGTLSICLFYFLAENITSRFVAFLGACYYVLYPARISYVNTVLTETLFTFLLLLGMYLIFSFVKTKQQFYIAAAGAVLGLASLCRPIALFYLFVLTVILTVVLFKSFFEKARFVILPFVLAATIVIIPWSIRNTIVSNQFVLIQSTGPANYYIPTRFDFDQSNESVLWEKFSTEDEYGKRLNSAISPSQLLEADKLAFDLAVRNIKSNPPAYLFSRIKAYPYLFINSFDTFTGLNQSFSSAISNKNYLVVTIKIILLLLFSLLPILVGILGFYRDRSNKLVFIIACFILFNLIIHIPLWIEYRFWIPVFPFVVLSALSYFGTGNNEEK